MTPSVTIAPLTAANLDDAAALYVATFNAAPWLDAWTNATARARLADFLHAPGATALSAHLPDGELAGFVFGNREQWYTGVHFNLRELCLRADSVERVYLLTAREGQAAAFYQHLGCYICPKMALLAHQL